MKIMKVLDKKVDGKTYYKYRINLPKEIVEKAHFDEGDVKISLEGDKIILERQKDKKTNKKLTNEEKNFKKELLKIISD